MKSPGYPTTPAQPGLFSRIDPAPFDRQGVQPPAGQTEESRKYPHKHYFASPNRLKRHTFEPRTNRSRMMDYSDVFVIALTAI
jgi:hypothetical protein